MQTGDGLLARVRVAGSVLTPSQLADLASLATAHGNGLVEVTARGNLQVRGLRPETAQPFASAVKNLLAVDAGLVVDRSPLAGIDPHERADPTLLAQGIRAGAVAFAGRLGPKVSVVVDGGGQISLAPLKADIRLVALGQGRWAVSLGGGHEQIMNEDSAVAAALALLGALAALGPEARATDLFPGREMSKAPPRSKPGTLPEGPGGATFRLELTGGHTQQIALPFGQIESVALTSLMEWAQVEDIDTIRLAPGHALLIDNASETLIHRAAKLGFIIDPADPRRQVSACIGDQGCASGHIPARQIAGQLAPHLSDGQHLHVSGCAKGCAHPRAAAVTLVGRTDGIGLVINGRAGDTPQKILDETALVAALAPSRDRR